MIASLARKQRMLSSALPLHQLAMPGMPPVRPSSLDGKEHPRREVHVPEGRDEGALLRSADALGQLPLLFNCKASSRKPNQNKVNGKTKKMSSPVRLKNL